MELVQRTDGEVCETLDARELWDKISHAAWACADPGLQYDTTITNGTPVRKAGVLMRLTPVPSICSWMIQLAIWLL